MSKVTVFVKARLDEWKNNIARSISDDQGFIQRGRLSAQPLQRQAQQIQQGVSNFNQSSRMQSQGFIPTPVRTNIVEPIKQTYIKPAIKGFMDPISTAKNPYKGEQSLAYDVGSYFANAPGSGVADDILRTAPLVIGAIKGISGKGDDILRAAQNVKKGLKGRTPPLSPIEDVGGQLASKVGRGSGVGESGVKQLRVKPTRIEQVAIDETAPIEEKMRGFVTSVKESFQVTDPTKVKVQGSYVPKPNKKLMGEATALLEEGASIKFNQVEGLDKKIAATIQEAINLDRAGNPQAAANLYNNLSEQGTELGRGVQAFSMIDKMSPEAIALSAAGKIKSYNKTATRKIPELTGEQVRIISDKIAAMDGLTGREKNIAIHDIQQTINDFIPSSIGDKAITIWKAGLLTSLRTHERNILGNTLHQGAEILKDIPATITDKLLGLRTGQRTTTFTTRGMKQGVQKGVQSGVDILQTGFDPEEAISKYDLKRITWSKNPVEQALKKYTDVVFRTLGAADKPFWHSAFARSLYDQAGAEAINVGRQGNKKFIERLVNKPTEKMLLEATKDANISTFKNKNVLGSAVSNAKKVFSKNEWGKLVSEGLAPFTGVPSSIAGQLVAYSPIGLINGIKNAGRVVIKNVPDLQRQASQEVGRGIIGTGLIGLGSYLMSKGLMTGNPKDQAESDQWALEGKQRNSILINGKWRGINSIGPEAIILLAGAKFKEAQNEEKGFLSTVGNTGAQLLKDYTQQTFLQGIQQPLEVITDPKRNKPERYLGAQMSSVVPNIVKDTAKAFDPLIRENNKFGDYIKNSIPGLRNKSLAKRGALGEQVKQEPTGLGAYIDLFNSKTPSNDPLIQELGRLNNAGFNATPSKIRDQITHEKEKIKLTPQQLDNLEAKVGELAKPALTDLINSNGYKGMTDEEKMNSIDSTMTRVRKIAREEFTSGSTDMQSPIETGGRGEENNNKGSIALARVYGYGKYLGTPPSTGFEKYDWEDNKLSEAVALFNDKKMNGSKKESLLKQYGYHINDLRYEAYSRLSQNARAGYLKDELSKQDPQQRIETLKSLRTESISGKVVATDSVLKELNDEGLISDADYKALKAVKYGKDGKPTAKSLKAKKGKKPKKLSVARVGGRKAGKISVKKAKKTPLKALKLKQIKLVARKSQVKPKA